MVLIVPSVDSVEINCLPIVEPGVAYWVVKRVDEWNCFISFLSDGVGEFYGE